MGRTALGWAVLGTALAVGGWLSTGCAPSAVGADEPASPSPRPGPALVVRTVAPVRVEEGGGFPTQLYVERDVSVTASSTGRIEQLLVDRGERVKAGQPLAVVETDLAAAELRMSEQELRYREAEYERATKLHDESIVSSEEQLRKEIERDMTATEVELARTRLDRCTIRAPFDGTVVERLAVVGQRVDADEAAELFRIVASDPLRARAYVPESSLAGIRVGSAASVTVGDDPKPRKARVVFVGQAIDPGSGTAPAIVELAARDGARIGANATIRFDELPTVALFRIPREAVRGGTVEVGTAGIVLVAQSGRAVPRNVELVRVDGADLLVRGEMAENDRVIFAPTELEPGQAVDARTEPGR